MPKRVYEHFNYLILLKGIFETQFLREIEDVQSYAYLIPELSADRGRPDVLSTEERLFPLPIIPPLAA